MSVVDLPRTVGVSGGRSDREHVTTLERGDRDALLAHIRAVEEIQRAVLARLERIEEESAEILAALHQRTGSLGHVAR